MEESEEAAHEETRGDEAGGTETGTEVAGSGSRVDFFLASTATVFSELVALAAALVAGGATGTDVTGALAAELLLLAATTLEDSEDGGNAIASAPAPTSTAVSMTAL